MYDAGTIVKPAARLVISLTTSSISCWLLSTSPGRDDRHAIGIGHKMVGDLALRAFPGHVEGHGTVAFRFQERVELRRAGEPGRLAIFTLGSNAMRRFRPSEVTVSRCAITTTCLARLMMLSSSMD